MDVPQPMTIEDRILVMLNEKSEVRAKVGRTPLFTKRNTAAAFKLGDLSANEVDKAIVQLISDGQIERRTVRVAPDEDSNLLSQRTMEELSFTLPS